MPDSRLPSRSTTTDTFSRTSGRRSAVPLAIGAHDLHRLPFAMQRGHHLHHTGIAWPAHRRRSRPGSPPCCRTRPGPAGSHPNRAVRWCCVARPRRCRCLPPRTAETVDGRPFQGGFGQFAGMGVAGLVAQHRAQAEPCGRVVIGGPYAPILHRDAFALPVFEEQLAVVGALQGVGGDTLRQAAIQRRIGTRWKNRSSVTARADIFQILANGRALCAEKGLASVSPAKSSGRLVNYG